MVQKRNAPFFNATIAFFVALETGLYKTTIQVESLK